MMGKVGSLRNKKLALFFTFNVSLRTWHNRGMIAREVAIYNKLGTYFDRIYFFTYGDLEDFRFRKYLQNNIIVVPFALSRINKHSRLFFLNKLMYSLLLPIIHRRILKNVDILKTNQIMGAWVAIIAKLLYRKKLVVRQGYQVSLLLRKTYFLSIGPIRRFIGSFLLCFMKFLEFFAYLLADYVIVTSNADKKYIIKSYGVHPNKIVVVPNYVDTDLFKPMDNIRKERGRICFVGRLAPEKNLPMLIDAVKKLNVTLTIIGSGPLEKVLKMKVIKEKINNVTFLGTIPNEMLPRELNRSEAFILPSISEGNPKALLEAMACGIPVIGTDIDGIKEIIRHEENGLLCEINHESIRDAILRLLNDQKLREKLSLNARLFVEENYNLNTICRKELTLYQSLFR